jgi:hypothetical protein
MSMLIEDLFQLDRLVGFAMLAVASAVFLYYTIWTLFMVRTVMTVSARREA